jgi:transposase
MNTPRKRQRYTAEFKSDAVKLVVEHGYTCAEAARRLGVASNNVVRWVRQHRENNEATEQGLPSPQNLHAEIRRLRKENERLRMEREILKKAAAFFANESD